MQSRQTPYPVARMGLLASTTAGASAALLAGRVAEPVIVVGVIVLTSLFSWRHTPLAPAAVPSNRRITTVSRGPRDHSSLYS